MPCRHCASPIVAEKLAAHEASCDERQLECRHCSGYYAAKLHGAHERNCPLRIESCDQCRHGVLVLELAAHKLVECEERLVACPFCAARCHN